MVTTGQLSEANSTANMAGQGPAAVVGTVLLTLFALAWSGKWNSWAYSWLLYSTITIFPALGAGLVVYALLPLLPDAVGGPLAILAVLALIAGIVIFLWPPIWFGPRWLRDEVEARRRGHPSPRWRRS